MPKMQSLKKFVLPSTSGHMIAFERLKPVDVPLAAVKDAQAAGCEFVDAADGDAPEFDDLSKARVQFNGNVRDSLLYLAIKNVIAKNDAKEFDAGQNPNVPAIEDRLGFDVTKKEINAMHKKFREFESENKDFPLHPNALDILRVIEAESRLELDDMAEHIFKMGAEESKALTVRELRRTLLVKLSGLEL